MDGIIGTMFMHKALIISPKLTFILGEDANVRNITMKASSTTAPKPLMVATRTLLGLMIP